VTHARLCFVNDMVSWLNARLAPPGVCVTAATPLFASGLISSIKVLELIAFTERAIGHPIADKDIRLDNFRTVERIAEVFVREEDHAAA
jgi:methoxymalonate biosynthesis acyl carrier protein